MLWGWLRTSLDPVNGWQGAQSVPRVVEANKNSGDGRSLINYPLPELGEQLRDTANAADLSGATLTPGSVVPIQLLGGRTGRMVDIEATITFSFDGSSSGGALSCGVRVLMDPKNPSSGEGTNVLVTVDPASATANADAKKKMLVVSVSDSLSKRKKEEKKLQSREGVISGSAATTNSNSSSSTGDEVEESEGLEQSKFFWRVAVPENRNSSNNNGDVSVALRVLVDSSMVESFVDGGVTTHTVLTVPSDPSFVGLAAVAQLNGGDDDGGSGGGHGFCTFETLKVYPMNPFKYDLSLCATKGCLYP